MRWLFRIFFLLILLVMSSVVAVRFPVFSWIDWFLPILFFGIRDAPWFVAVVCATLMGVLLTLFTIDPPVDLVVKAILVSLLVVWLFPLIQWNHPKNTLVAWWGVVVMDGLASVFMPQFLGHSGPGIAEAPDAMRLLATGFLGSLAVGILYGSRKLGSPRFG